MFRNLSIMLGIAGVCALAAGGIAVAAGGFSHDGGAHDRTLVLLDITQTSTDIDADQSNSFTVGDYFVTTDVLKTRSGSATVGSLHGMCTVISFSENQHSAVARCVATVRLNNGSIELSGAAVFSDNADDFTVAITGGTGVYDEIHGQARFQGLGNGNRHLATFDIDA